MKFSKKWRPILPMKGQRQTTNKELKWYKEITKISEYKTKISNKVQVTLKHPEVPQSQQFIWQYCNKCVE